MKKLSILLAAVLAASCSPRVTTLVSNPLAPLGPEEHVTVIAGGRDLPQEASYVGKVEVSDTGFSTGCTYDDVVALARVEALKAGGNLLHIDSHRWPDYSSTCHQIIASIFYVDGPYPAGEALDERPDADVIPADTEPHFMTVRSDTPGFASASAPLYLSVPEHRLNRWRVALDAGYNCRTGKIGENKSGGELTDSEWRKLNEPLRHGVSYGISATAFYNDYYGIGMKFTGNHSENKIFGAKYGIDTYYFAPEFMTRLPMRNNKNLWILSMSMGYVSYVESVRQGLLKITYKAGGFKTTAEMGFDFRVADGFFLGLKLATAIGAIYVEGVNEDMILTHAIEIGGGLRF